MKGYALHLASFTQHHVYDIRVIIIWVCTSMKLCRWVEVSTTELALVSGTQMWGLNPGQRVAGAMVGECGTTLEDTQVLLSNPCEDTG
ncbi:xylulose kinase-like [Pongo pygmaeus]|uniref:xylulose kinase-like n=1 Tax=Pongo pygmaeus TaxID=9600 RepID=UPI00300CF606